MSWECVFLLLSHAWILFFGLAASPTSVSYQSPIPIGAILDADRDTGTKSGFIYAISTHNERNRVHGKGIVFSTVLDQLEVHNSFKFASRMCSQMTGGIFAFYGRTSTSSTCIAQAFSQQFHMPFMTLSLSGAVSKPYRPFTLSLTPHIVDAVVDLLIDYQWKRLDYVYDSDQGLFQVQYIHNRLKQLGHYVEITYCRLEGVHHIHEDLRRLDKKNENSVKNFVLDMSSQAALRSVLAQIPEVGMNRAGYSYILATMDIETLNLSRFRHGGVNITGFQLINHSNSAVREFLRTWSVLEPAVWPGAGSDKVEVDAALSVDTLEAFRLALEAMVGRRHDVFHSTFRRGVVYNLNKTVGIPCSTRPVLPWMHGTEIYYSLKRVDFEGLTGRVSFDNRGYRNNYKLDIFTVSMDKGPSKTGEWHSEYGLERQQQFVAQPSANGTHAQRCRIVTSILTKPFLMMRQAPGSMGLPLTGNDKYEGYCKDLADELKERLLMEYILVPVKDGQFGTQLPNGSWTGIIGELRRGLADLAVAPLTITSDRERVVDFSKPFMNIAISIMIKRPEMQKPGVFAFMEPFSVPLWACIVLAYIAVSLTVFVVSKFSPFELRIRSYRYDRYIVYDFNICNSFWFSMSALMMQGSDHCPRSVAGRVIGGAWWFFVLIVITSYTANLAAFLTIERMLHPIESADDLAKQTDIAYGMLESGSTRTFFQTSEVPIYRKMWNYMSTASPSVMVKTVEEGVERVRNSKGKYAFLIESSMNNYYNNRKPCDTMRVGGDLNLEGFGIATPHGSELNCLNNGKVHEDQKVIADFKIESETLNYAALKMKEDGTLHRLENKWWYEKGECGTDTGHKESKKRSLSLSNVAGVFYIMVSGLVIAIVLGLLEVYYYRRQRRKKEDALARTDFGTPVGESIQENVNGLLEPHRATLRHNQ